MACLGALTAASCGSSSGEPTTADAAVMGAADMHCGSGADMTKQEVGVCYTDEVPSNVAACGVVFQAGAAPQDDGGAPADDAGASSDDGGASSDYGPTLPNATGYDDDCKYQLSWTSTPVAVNKDVTFTVTATRLSDGQPAHCAGISAEAFLDNTPAVPTRASSEMGASGKYAVGPLRFPLSGQWTVRFHLYEECSDSREDSPHGHAAFYVNVP
jgi:hypothetical protein